MGSYRDNKSKKNPVISISIVGNMENLPLTKIMTTPTYNQCMSGGDKSNKVLYSYLDERRANLQWFQGTARKYQH